MKEQAIQPPHEGSLAKRKVPTALVLLLLVPLVLLALYGAFTYDPFPNYQPHDRAGCLMNIRNAQQAVRSYSNMYHVEVSEPIARDVLIGDGKFLESAPTCPSGGTYTFLDHVPEKGVLFMRCSDPEHTPDDHANW